MAAPNAADVEGNGHGDPNPRCSWNERRLTNVERYAHETRGALSAVASGLSDLKAWGEGLETRWLKEFARVADTTEENRKALKTLVENLEVGHARIVDASEEVRPAMQSLDYEEGGDTQVQPRPELVVRMKTAERSATAHAARAESLEAKVAALTARLEERDRQSDRVRENAKAADESALKKNELAVARWKVTAGVILGVLATLAAIGQAIGPIIKWIFGG